MEHVGIFNRMILSLEALPVLQHYSSCGKWEVYGVDGQSQMDGKCLIYFSPFFGYK